MTPKEKAKELIDKFYNHTFNVEKDTEDNFESAKECALICCDEVLKANHIWYEGTIPYIYWNNVKKQIEKL